MQKKLREGFACGAICARAYRGEVRSYAGRYRCAAELLVYRAEVERCREGERCMHMHMQRGGEGGERATDSASRSIEEGAEQDAWRGKVCCEGLEERG